MIRSLAWFAAVYSLGTAARSDEAQRAHYFGHDEVAAHFAAGTPLLATAAYKVNPSRRNAPGLAEIHECESDILYVLQGRARLVTGGRLHEPKRIAAHELRGTAIDGGASQALGPGDVAVIPAGVPHWFAEVVPPFLYFVVKPIAREPRP